MKLKSIYKYNLVLFLKLFCFSVAVFCYYFQFIFENLSAYIVPFLGICLVLLLKRIAKRLTKYTILIISFYYIYLAFILIVSGLSAIEMNRIMRFFLILFCLPLFFLIDVKKDYRYYYASFLLFSYFKIAALMVVYIAVLTMGIKDNTMVLLLLGGPSGGVYFDDNYLHIQVHGNALLMIAFMLRFINTRKIDILNIVLLFGVIIAGNFAFLLGLLLFVIFYLFRFFLFRSQVWYMNIVLLCFSVIAIFVLFLPYMQAQIEKKSHFSNVVRIEQAQVLLSDHFFTGNGLGNYVKMNTSTRKYDGDIYYELQSLYIINQIGIMGYLLIIFCTIYCFYKQNKEMLPIYLLYLFYSFWNPYCFDTTHMMAGFLLVSNKAVHEV